MAQADLVNMHPKDLFNKIVSGEITFTNEVYQTITGEYVANDNPLQHADKTEAWKYACYQLCNLCAHLQGRILEHPELSEQETAEILGKAAIDYNPEMPE